MVKLLSTKIQSSVEGYRLSRALNLKVNSNEILFNCKYTQNLRQIETNFVMFCENIIIKMNVISEIIKNI